ncbi:MAG: ABA4-like family protein [Cyanobacteria bacterium P01_G01_bin.67]
MTFSQAFNALFYYVTPFWFVMIVFPNWNITKKVMSSFITLIPLCGFYIYYLLITTDIASLTSAFSLQLSEYVKLFSQEGGALGVTVHFVAMDFFVGRWIYLQGQEKNIWTKHSLILCLSFGPSGLLSHIITAYFFDKNNNSDDDDSNLEEAKTDAAVS